jgi:hypothetical protein
MAENRLDSIEPDLGGFSEYSHYLTGTVSSGEQVLIMRHYPGLHAYRFDREGNYLRQESREISGDPRDKLPDLWAQDLIASLRAWVGELGLTPGKIRVKKFRSDGSPTLWIRDYPMGWDDAEWGEGESLEDMQEGWDEQGAFVLNLDGFEHNINQEGKRFQ